MTIEDAQKEVRTVYLGGFTGLLVDTFLWGLSAAFGTWLNARLAILTLVVGRRQLPRRRRLSFPSSGSPSSR